MSATAISTLPVIAIASPTQGFSGVKMTSTASPK
jgi:hypothetical protein